MVVDILVLSGVSPGLPPNQEAGEMKAALLAMTYLADQQKVKFDQRRQVFFVEHSDVRNAVLLAEAVLKFQGEKAKDAQQSGAGEK